VKWGEEYAIGEPHIDEQHKMLFKMAGDFQVALEEGRGEKTYGVLLDFLERYFRGHFKYEERCMEEYRCPIADENREDHARFLSVYEDFRKRYESRGYLSGDAHELMGIAEDWLRSHIGRIDLQLKPFVKK
jgi:hemerythrin